MKMATSASAPVTESGRFRTWLTTKQGLLFRKAMIAFIVAFLGVLIPALLQVFDAIQDGDEPSAWKAVLMSAIAGAFAAGIRAVLALSPLNLSSTDSLTSLGSKEDTVTVTTKHLRAD
jgi:hypothetical protein